MYKLVAFFALLAVCAAAPKPYLYAASPVVGVVPAAHVVPAVSTYSSYSSSVVHPPTVPVVHAQVVQSPVVHAAVPVAYSAPTVFI